MAAGRRFGKSVASGELTSAGFDGMGFRDCRQAFQHAPRRGNHFLANPITFN